MARRGGRLRAARLQLCLPGQRRCRRTVRLARHLPVDHPRSECGAIRLGRLHRLLQVPHSGPHRGSAPGARAPSIMEREHTMTVSAQDVLNALRTIEDPDLHRDIVSLGFVQTPEIDGGRVSVRIVLTTPACPVRDHMEMQARELLLALPGVTEANVTMEANVLQHRT